MKLAELEDALLAAIRSASALSYLRTVEPVSDRSLDLARGNFLVVPPAVLSFFASSQLRSRDLAARTYDYTPRLLLFAVARNLRGAREEKLGGPPGEIGAYRLLDDLKAALAGARLPLPGSSFQPVVELAGEQLESFTPDFSAYSLELLIRGPFHV
ncbi:MAG: DUF1834 family protein [Desulfuromonadales bacterium]|nr:DUF1834 family protein [Desulfuromonadales bacterium]